MVLAFYTGIIGETAKLRAGKCVLTVLDDGILQRLLQERLYAGR